MQLAPYKPLPATSLIPAPYKVAPGQQQPEQHPVASTSRLPAAQPFAAARRPRVKGNSKATTNQRAPSRPPSPTSSEELNEARLASTLRLASAWADIEHRHQSLLPSSSTGAGWRRWASRWLPEEEDDIIDLETMEIVQDRGVIRGAKKGAFEIGGEGGWFGHSQRASPGEGDGGIKSRVVDEDSEDELAAFDQLESLPSQSFREERRVKEAERLHLLEFTLQETKARQMRASVAAGGSKEVGVNDDEWDRTRRKLERGVGNEVLEAPAGAVGKPEHDMSDQDEDDPFAAFEVTPTTARTLPRTKQVVLATPPVSSAQSKGKEKAMAPPSTTAALRKGLKAVTVRASPSPAVKAPPAASPARRASVPPKPSVSTATSYGLRSSYSFTDRDAAAASMMPPPPPPSARIPTSRSLPSLSNQPSSSSPLARPSTAAPKRAPSTTPRARRESTFFLDLEVPVRRRSVTPAVRRHSSVLPPSSAIKTKPAALSPPKKQPTPLKQQLPPSPSPELGLLSSRAQEEEVVPGKRPRTSDPIVLELGDSDPDESSSEEEQPQPSVVTASRRLGLATPPNSKGSTSARRSASLSAAPISASPTKKQRRSASPLKQSVQAPPPQSTSKQSPGMFALTKSAAALAVASPRPSSSGTPRPSQALSSRRRSSGSTPRPPRPSTIAPPRPAPKQDVFSSSAAAIDPMSEDEDELLLTATSARESPLKPEGVEQSLEGIMLGAKGMGYGWVAPKKGAGEGGWEVLDLTGESEDELDLLGRD